MADSGETLQNVLYYLSAADTVHDFGLIRYIHEVINKRVYRDALPVSENVTDLKHITEKNAFQNVILNYTPIPPNKTSLPPDVFDKLTILLDDNSAPITEKNVQLTTKTNYEYSVNVFRAENHKNKLFELLENKDALLLDAQSYNIIAMIKASMDNSTIEKKKTLYYVITPETVNDPAPKKTPQAVDYNNNGSQLITCIDVDEGSKIYSFTTTKIDEFSKSHPCNCFFTKYQFYLSPFSVDKFKNITSLKTSLTIKYNNHEEFIRDPKKANSIGSLKSFLVRFIKYIEDELKPRSKKQTNSLNDFKFNSKIQQKRSGDWLQVLACNMLSARKFVEFAKPKEKVQIAKTYLITHDIIALAFALLNGVNCIFTYNVSNNPIIMTFTQNSLDVSIRNRVEYIQKEFLKTSGYNYSKLKSLYDKHEEYKKIVFSAFQSRINEIISQINEIISPIIADLDRELNSSAYDLKIKQIFHSVTNGVKNVFFLITCLNTILLPYANVLQIEFLEETTSKIKIMDEEVSIQKHMEDMGKYADKTFSIKTFLQEMNDTKKIEKLDELNKMVGIHHKLQNTVSVLTNIPIPELTSVYLQNILKDFSLSNVHPYLKSIADKKENIYIVKKIYKFNFFNIIVEKNQNNDNMTNVTNVTNLETLNFLFQDLFYLPTPIKTSIITFYTRFYNFIEKIQKQDNLSLANKKALNCGITFCAILFRNVRIDGREIRVQEIENTQVVEQKKDTNESRTSQELLPEPKEETILSNLLNQNHRDSLFHPVNITTQIYNGIQNMKTNISQVVVDFKRVFKSFMFQKGGGNPNENNNNNNIVSGTPISADLDDSEIDMTHIILLHLS